MNPEACLFCKACPTEASVQTFSQSKFFRSVFADLLFSRFLLLLHLQGKPVFFAMIVYFIDFWWRIIFADENTERKWEWERRTEKGEPITRTRVLLRTAELIVYVKKCFQRITLYWGHVLLAFVLIHVASDSTDPVPMERLQPIGEWRGLRDLRDLQGPMETYLKMAYSVATWLTSEPL